MRLLAVFLPLVYGAVVQIGISCFNNTDYLISFPDGNPFQYDPPIDANAGDILNFTLNTSCPTHPFQIRVGPPPSLVIYTIGVVGMNTTNGSVVFTTDLDTLASLSYRCGFHGGMTGPITIYGGIGKATVPNGTATNATFTSVDFFWSPATSNCTFSHWNVVQTPGPVGGTCVGLIDRSVTNCTATGLTSNTLYSFTIQEVCNNQFASSPISTVATARTLARAATPPTLVTLTTADITTTVSWTAGAANDCNFSAWEVDFVTGGSGPVPGCQGLTTRAIQTCIATGLTPLTNYSFQVRETCFNDANSSFASSGIASTRPTPPTNVMVTNPGLATLDISWSSGGVACPGTTLYTAVSQPGGTPLTGCTNVAGTSCTANSLTSHTNYSISVLQHCSGAPDSLPSAPVSQLTLSVPATPPTGLSFGATSENTLDLIWNFGTSNDCQFSTWDVQQFTTGGSVPAAGCTGISSRGTTQCTVSGLSPVTTYTFAVAEVCGDSGANSARSNNATKETRTRRPTAVLAFNPTASTLNISWNAGGDACTGMNYTAMREPGHVPLAGCVQVSTTACLATGLTSNTNYSVSVQQNCQKIDEVSLVAAGNSIFTLAVAAVAPSVVVVTSPTETTLSLSWTGGADNDCTWSNWDVRYVVGGSGVVSGCGPFQNRSTQTCTANGLSPYTNYSFSIATVCVQPLLNSPSTTSSVTLTAVAAPSSMTLSNPGVTTMTLTWTAAAQQCLSFSRWDVQSGAGGSVSGCTNLNNRTTTTCNAIGLPPGTSLSFRVREVCSDVSSVFTTSNSLSTNPIPLPPGTRVQVNCTAGNSVRYLVDGIANQALHFSAGTVILFTLTGCEGFPFAIQRFGAPASGGLLAQLTAFGAGTETTGIQNGTLVLNTSTSTPTYLTYRCLTFPAMTGTIEITGGTVTLPDAPVNPGASNVADVSATISWTAPTAPNDCNFTAWKVSSAGTTVSCSSTVVSVTSCNLTGLSPDTNYTFGVAQECNGVSTGGVASFSFFTKPYGSVVKCVLGGTCNCGNATSCECSGNAEACNCQNADLCTCNVGRCNGGYAKKLICGTGAASCNRQCAETCVGVCSVSRRLFGVAGCVVGGATGLSANFLLLSVLFLFVVFK